MAKLLFSFILLVFFSIGAQSQNNKNQTSKVVRTIYYYSFSGVQTQEQVNAVEEQIAALQYVENVKTKYKPEKQAAQVILVVATPVLYGENSVDFEVIQLKQIVLKNGLTPGDLDVKPYDTEDK